MPRKIGSHHGETRSKADRVTLNDPIPQAVVEAVAKRERQEAEEMLATLDKQIARLQARRTAVLATIARVDPFPRGCTVRYVGVGVPRLSMQHGKVIGRDAKGWLLVDYNDGYGPVKCAESSLKKL